MGNATAGIKEFQIFVNLPPPPQTFELSVLGATVPMAHH